MKRVLITGTAGFIGYHLAHRLCSENYKVIGIDNLNNYYDVKLKQDRTAQLTSKFSDNEFTFIKLDICDASGMNALFSEYEFDMIIHLAAQAGVRYSLENPQSYIDSNITGFLNILEACRHNPVKSLFYASSSSVYGGNRELPFSEDQKVDQPYSLYGVTKKSNELMAHAYSHLFNINTIGLRFFTVYGPWGRPDMALFKFTQNIANGEEIEVYNYGKHSRSFTYIEDIIEGIYRLIQKSYDKKVLPETKNYQIYNIGGDQSVGLMDYVHEIENHLQKKAKIKFLPMQPGDVEKTEASTALLETETGFIPRTRIHEGIKKFIDWYLSYYHA
ncbi:MAG: SDR family NAD(P)-dependent oxidoreductase [Fidelibacterota bacterium]